MGCCSLSSATLFCLSIASGCALRTHLGFKAFQSNHKDGSQLAASSSNFEAAGAFGSFRGGFVCSSAREPCYCVWPGPRSTSWLQRRMLHCPMQRASTCSLSTLASCG